MKPDEHTSGLRVEIHADDRDVVVEAPAGPLKPVADRALALWRATAPKAGAKKPPTEPAGSAGFVLADRSDNPGLMPTEVELPNRLADRLPPPLTTQGDADVRRAGF